MCALAVQYKNPQDLGSYTVDEVFTRQVSNHLAWHTFSINRSQHLTGTLFVVESETMPRAPVIPVEKGGQDGEKISINGLDPDLNGDGKVEDWERDVFNELKVADQDGDGFITRSELFTFIRKAKLRITEAAKGDIVISQLNPDTDGDGRVAQWEAEVFERILQADADKSGAISVKEVPFPSPPSTFAPLPSRRHPIARRPLPQS